MAKKDRVIHEREFTSTDGVDAIFNPIGTLLGLNQKPRHELTLDDGSTVTGTGRTPLDAKIDAYKKLTDE